MKSRRVKANVTCDNTNVNLTFKGKQVTLQCGTKDLITVREIDGDIVVMSRNTRLGYYGVEVFNQALNKVSECFLQSPDEIESVCGRGFDNLLFLNQMKALYSVAISTR